MSLPENHILLGNTEAADNLQALNLKYANRHGLITGATGTGKTVTLQIIAEGLSEAGVPVFMSDVKGDLSGMSEAGVEKDFLENRAKTIGFDNYQYKDYPTTFWDLYGKQGHKIRTTVQDMGALLLAELLGLNDTQSGVLNIAFIISREKEMPLIDLKDLRALLNHISENRTSIGQEYGNVSAASVGAIQRKLLSLKEQGIENFWGEPALDINDFFKQAEDGRGIVNILSASKLFQSPKLYATFLLWLLNELFELLPEQGDSEKPKLVFFFDEAHLLFDSAPKALLDKVEQVVRLIRSKGIGVFFVTQNPADVPEAVLGQLGNRVQHALRAFTPKDRKAVKAAAETFRANPKFNAEKVIMELGVGEALVSTLLKKGVPSMVERTLIRPPSSKLGPANPKLVKGIIAMSEFAAKYDKTIDRESAYEMLKERSEAKRKVMESEAALEDKVKKTRKSKGRSRQTVWEASAKSFARSMSTKLATRLLKGIFGR